MRKAVKKYSGKSILFVSLLFAALFVFYGTAYAGTGSGGAPWEKALQTLTGSISGPVAFSVCILMLVAGGCALAFGGDMQGWIKFVAVAVCIAAIIGLAPDVLAFFGIQAMTVA
jgi:type IV secretion system protein VirB2